MFIVFSIYQISESIQWLAPVLEVYLAVHHFGTGINLVGRFAAVSNDDILAINKALVPKKEKILILKFVK